MVPSEVTTPKEHLHTAFASLHIAIKKHALKKCNQYIKLQHMLRIQEDKLFRANADDYTPRSAKFKFKLTSNSVIKETDEFIRQQILVKIAFSDLNKKLTESVKGVIQLEID